MKTESELRAQVARLKREVMRLERMLERSKQRISDLSLLWHKANAYDRMMAGQK